MDADTEKIYARLGQLEAEIANLREGYVIVNARYNQSLAGMKQLTHHSTLAANKCLLFGGLGTCSRSEPDVVAI